jgi:hypothetical protein
MSQMCQKRKSLLSADHLVGGCKQRRRDAIGAVHFEPVSNGNVVADYRVLGGSEHAPSQSDATRPNAMHRQRAAPVANRAANSVTPPMLPA